MPNTYSFPAVAKVGAWAEEQIALRFEQSGWRVDRVQKDPFGRGMDFDLVVESPVGGVFLIEVKGDRYTTGNLYVEEVSNADKGTPGCLLYSQADWFAYYYVTLGVCYMIPARAFQTWAARRLQDYPTKQVRTGQAGKVQYNSTGRPVPMVDIQREVPGVYKLDGLPVMEG
jgi:hypothetical protein